MVSSIRLPTIRDIQRLTPNQRQMLRMVTGRRIREPIPSSKKKKVLEKVKNTCQWKGCSVKNKNVKLQFHHKNLKNDDHKLSNIMVLCPNHHSIIHTKIKRIVKKDIVGREKSSKLKNIKSKTKKKTTKKKTKRRTPYGLLSSSQKWFYIK